MPPIKEAIALKLTTWQKRMVKDFMPGTYRGIALTKISEIFVKIGTIKCPASYKIPPEGIRKGNWVLYLSDAQIKTIMDGFKSRIAIDSINISPDFIRSGDIVFR
ncbi:MAG: hypothetical protein A2Z15_06190 [Chloroflexi bacterium RBG_16_50_11]|nr:MAG: hypothetical protein A2Z15_06190 [Chloroflexi bacterium RBG_16_50_11]